MEDATILKLASRHYQSGAKDPLPFPLTEQWRNNRERMAEAIPKFTSAQEAVHWAQRNQNTGFDHRYQDVRENERNVIAQKRILLEERFHGFDLDSSGFREPDCSLPSSVYHLGRRVLLAVTTAGQGSPEYIESIDPHGGVPVSNILFWHLNQYLSVVWQLRFRNLTVVEIGGGYGGLARLFVGENPRSFYSIVDLPESLFFAECYLRLSLPVSAAIAYAGCDSCPAIRAVKLSTPYRSGFSSVTYDVAVAAASLQEMEEDAVRYWLSFVSRWANNFYSLNYASTPLIGDGAGLPERFLGPGWRRSKLERNPAVVTIDARNDWVELLYVKGRNP